MSSVGAESVKMRPALSIPVRALRIGVIAGLVGGATMAAYLIVTILAGRGGLEGVATMFQHAAAALVGPTATLNAAFVPVGVLLHFAVSIFWALGYIYLARTQPQLVGRPIISGIGFGFVVYLVMTIVLVGANQFTPPSAQELLRALIAHCVFYGMVVALVVNRFAAGDLSDAAGAPRSVPPRRAR